jgi:integrase
MRGHIRRRGQRSFAVVVELDRDESGKRKQKWHSVKGSRRDAETKLAELLHELGTGGYVEPARLSVAQFLEKWLQDYARINVSGKTFERYSEIVRNDLIPAIGAMQLQKLRPVHIQGYYSRALTTGRKDGKGGLSPQTVVHHHRVLREALKHAVRWQLLTRNPAEAVDPPRIEHKEMQIMDEAKSVWMIEGAQGTRLHVPIVLATCTGMRRGEILALKWADVDLSSGFLHVRRTLEQTRQQVGFKEPKSRYGRRLISLPTLAVEVLEQHHNHQLELKSVLGAAYEDNDLVCCQEDGRLWRPSAFTSAYFALLRRRKIRSIPFHALRHSHASQLLRAGISPKVISERLGHAKVGFTLEVYSHLLPGMQEEAAQRMDTGLRAALEKQRVHLA